jgi:hypothetical protein
MNRIKVIGPALVAAFASSVVAASAASATPFEHFRAEAEGKVVAVNHNKAGTETSINKFKVDSGEAQCKKASFESAKKQPTTAVSIKVKPKYEECSFTPLGGNVTPATVTTTECEYNLEIETAKTTGQVKVECAAGKAITVTAAGVCEVKVGSQTLKAQVTYENLGTLKEREVKVTSGSTKQIEYEESLACPFKKEAKPKDGQYEGANWAHGVNELGVTDGVWVE